MWSTHIRGPCGGGRFRGTWSKMLALAHPLWLGREAPAGRGAAHNSTSRSPRGRRQIRRWHQREVGQQPQPHAATLGVICCRPAIVFLGLVPEGIARAGVAEAVHASSVAPQHRAGATQLSRSLQAGGQNDAGVSGQAWLQTTRWAAKQGLPAAPQALTGGAPARSGAAGTLGAATRAVALAARAVALAPALAPVVAVVAPGGGSASASSGGRGEWQERRGPVLHWLACRSC